MRLAIAVLVALTCLPAGCGPRGDGLDTVPSQECPDGRCPYRDNKTGPLDHYLFPSRCDAWTQSNPSPISSNSQESRK
jgi:hypothetical protein